MSSGKAHAAATKLLTLPAAVVAAQILPGQPLVVAVGSALGCLSGLLVEPDLDVDDITKSEWRVIKRLWVFGMLWVAFWYPYARLIPHRSPLSHFPVLGTGIRLLYMWGMFALIISLLKLPGQWLVAVADFVDGPLFVPWLFGLVVSDTGHYVMDKLSTAIKRRRRVRR